MQTHVKSEYIMLYSYSLTDWRHSSSFLRYCLKMTVKILVWGTLLRGFFINILDNLGSYLVKPESYYVWLCMTMYCFVWLYMTMYDFEWLCIAIYDYVGQCMTLYDYIWLYMTMYDYVWVIEREQFFILFLSFWNY